MNTRSNSKSRRSKHSPLGAKRVASRHSGKQQKSSKKKTRSTRTIRLEKNELNISALCIYFFILHAFFRTLNICSDQNLYRRLANNSLLLCIPGRRARTFARLADRLFRSISGEATSPPKQVTLTDLITFRSILGPLAAMCPNRGVSVALRRSPRAKRASSKFVILIRVGTRSDRKEDRELMC